MKRRLFVIMTALTLSTATFAGCGNTQATSAISEPTEAPVTEEVTPTEPVEEPTEAPTEQPTQQAEEPTAEPTEPVEEPTQPVETEPQFTYSDLSATMYAKSSVNVRNLPSTDGTKLGGLSTNQEVAVTGQCNETSWYRISYNGSEAFVSDKYLVTEKVVTQPVETAQSGGEVAQQPQAPSKELPSFPMPIGELLYNGENQIYFYYLAEDTSTKNSLADQAINILDEKGLASNSAYYCVGNSNVSDPNNLVAGEYKEGMILCITTTLSYE